LVLRSEIDKEVGGLISLHTINGFYGNTYETLPRENGFIYLKPVRILSDFISYLSDSNVILF
jgi:hypothetical protein